MRTSIVTASMALLSTAVMLAACGANPAPSPGGNTSKGASSTKHTTSNTKKAALGDGTKTAGSKNSTGTTGTAKNGGGGSNKAALGGGMRTAGSKNTTGSAGTAKNGGGGSNKGALGGGMKTAGSKNPAGTTRYGRGAASKAAATPIPLTNLPALTAIEPFNRAYRSYHAVSSFINEMGFHWMTQVPGIVYMTNNHNQITGVEATFPQNHGNYSWYDPATPPTILNASLAFYSEHLYFVPPSSITPAMPATTTSDLTSWTSFLAVNNRLQAYVKEPATYKGYTVYGPPHGLGIKVLVSPAGLVSGFMVDEPASWGWSHVYAEPPARPVMSRNFGRAYLSVFMVEPATATTGTGSKT